MAMCSRHPGELLPGCFYCRNHIEPRADRRGTAEDLYEALKALHKSGMRLSDFPIELEQPGNSTVAWNGTLGVLPDALLLRFDPD